MTRATSVLAASGRCRECLAGGVELVRAECGDVVEEVDFIGSADVVAGQYALVGQTVRLSDRDLGWDAAHCASRRNRDHTMQRGDRLVAGEDQVRATVDVGCLDPPDLPALHDPGRFGAPGQGPKPAARSSASSAREVSMNPRSNAASRSPHSSTWLSTAWSALRACSSVQPGARSSSCSLAVMHLMVRAGCRGANVLGRGRGR